MSAPHPTFAANDAPDQEAERTSGGRLLARLGSRSGTTLGRYELVRRIGRGGLGEVYEAVHRGLKKSVALKILLPEAAENDEMRERFLREGEVASHIRHPHVVDVTDVGEDGGIVYLVMELLDGEPFSSLIERSGRLSVERVLDVVMPIGAALIACHEQGVVHRDLKPENVFIARTAGGAVSKLLDFGISKMQRDGRRTAASTLLGTPSYMAPEQALGTMTVDARADQYSFALMVYEGVTGQLPFEAENVVALLHEVARGVTRPPSAYVRDLPPGLDEVLLRALSADPSARYPSMDALLQRLVMYASRRAVRAYRALRGLGDSVDSLPRIPSDLPPYMITAEILLPSDAPPPRIARVSEEAPRPPPPPAAPRRAREDDPTLAANLMSKTEAGRLAAARPVVTPAGLVVPTPEPTPVAAPAVTAAPEVRIETPRWVWAVTTLAVATLLVGIGLSSGLLLPGEAPASEPTPITATAASTAAAPGTTPAPAAAPTTAPAVVPAVAPTPVAPTVEAIEPAPAAPIRLSLTSTPPGAVVRMDNQRLGATPLTVELTASQAALGDDLLLTFSLPGHQPTVVQHHLEDASATVHAQLRRRATEPAVREGGAERRVEGYRDDPYQ